MGRTNASTGVKGLYQIKSGPLAGRLRLELRLRDDESGEVKTFTKLFPPKTTKRRASKERDDIIRQHGAGTLRTKREVLARAQSRVPIRELVERAIQFREADGGSPATLAEFRNVLNGHVAESTLGEMVPRDVDSDHLLAFRDALGSIVRGPKGNQEPRKLSPRTVRNVFKVLKQFFDVVRARKLDPLLRFNPVSLSHAERTLKLPQPKQGPVRFLPITGARALLAHPDVRPDRRVRYAMALLTGARDGELAGLTWSDLDLETSKGAIPVMRIEQALPLIGDGPGALKTEQSRRVIPLHRSLVPILRAWHDEGWALFAGRKPKPRDPVLPSSNGHAWRPTHMAEQLREDLVLAEVASEGLTFHACRRSFTTWLRDAGVPADVRRMLLGQIGETVEEVHYAGRTMATLSAAVAKLPDLSTIPRKIRKTKVTTLSRHQ